MQCPDANVLLEFVSGLLDGPPAAAVEQHMDRCARCRKVVGELGKLSSASRPPPDAGSEAESALAETKRSRDPPVSLQRARLEMGAFVDHFKIVRLLGRGGMGEVYLARDTQLGRQVALKVLHGTVTASEERERIGLEARITARFSHPNIVVVHAIGYHEGSPYLALEFLRGQTLQQRIQERELSLREVLRTGRDIARALAEAHHHEILHGDLKPANVMITRQGRVCVLDFGLALVMPSLARRSGRAALADDDGDAAATLTPTGPTGEIRGTPAYMAPEQWRAEEITFATDVWAWGMLGYELLCGRHPYHGVSALELSSRVCSADPVPPLVGDREVPASLSELIRSCLSKDPSARPTALEIAQQLDKLLAAHRAPHAIAGSPFRGLLPFDEEHSGVFFGRDAEIADIMERLRAEPVLPLVGPSGAGKSSLVQAGVIPRLREEGHMVVLRLRPGRRPFAALAAQLAVASRPVEPSDPGGISPTVAAQPRAMERSDAPGSGHHSRKGDEIERLAESLRAAPRRLNLLLHELADTRSCRVVLFVDQLEELYTSVSDPITRHDFMEAICTAADDPGAPVRVLFTLRDEFLVRLAEGSFAREVLSRILVLRPPGPASLREILLRPVIARGYSFEEPSLVQDMVDEVQGELSCLPLLQFAGARLWDNRDQDRRILRREDYAAMNGVGGALAHHADGVLAALPAGERALVRALFLRLVDVEGTRRVLDRPALLEGLAPRAREVLDRLVTARLITVKQSEASDEPDVELVHESLMQNWGRLRRWVRESREELAFLSEVGRAVELWSQRGRREEETWQGRALRDAEEAVARCSTPVPGLVRRFLQVGGRLAARRRRRRTALLAGGVIALALVAAAAIVVALVIDTGRRDARRQRDRAQAETQRAEGEKSTALREGARASLARGAVFEARARLRRALEIRDAPELRALWWRLSREPLHWRVPMGSSLYAVAFSPDGKTVAVASLDRAIYLYDVATRTQEVLRGHTDQIFSLAYSPDGKQLAAGTWGGIVLWDLAHRRKRNLKGHRGIVWGVGFGPRGRTLASGGADKTVRLWDLSSDICSAVMKGHTRPVLSVSFRADGRTIATASYDGTVRIWDVASRTPTATLTGHKGRVYSVRYSPDGRLLASGAHGSLRIWDARRHTLMRELNEHLGKVNSVSFSADSGLLAFGRADHSIVLWDVARGRLRARLTGHKLRVRDLAFGPRGRYLASVGNDRTVRVWDLRRATTKPEAGGHTGLVMGVDFGPRGARLASNGWDKTVRLWDVRQGTSRLAFGPLDRAVRALRFSPDGRLLATGGEDSTVRLWDLKRSRFRAVLRGHRGFVHDVGFDPSGKRLVSGSSDTTVRIWDVAKRALLKTLTGHSSFVLSVTFSPDGRLIASGSHDRTVRLWDPDRGAPLGVGRAHSDTIWGVRFTRQGLGLVSASQDGKVRSWQVDAGRELQADRVLSTFRGRGYRLDVHPDGQRVGVPRSDGTARIYDLQSRRYVVLQGHRGEVNQLRFGPRGRLVATASADGSVRLWETDTGRPVWRAPLLRRMGPELFNQQGWRVLAPGKRLATPGAALWRTTVEQRARLAVETPDGRYLCVVTHDPSLELWDLARDRRLQGLPLKAPVDLVAAPGGCVSLSGQVARLHRPHLAARVLHRAATAVASGPAEILVASVGKVLVYRADGEISASYPAGVDITALTRAGPWLALGFANGGIALLPTRRSSTPPTFSFAEVPPSPVVRLMPGPRGTLIAGFANGLLGLWSLRNGNRLEHRQLHGPVVHLLRMGHRLYAVTELGQVQILDFGVFHEPYCALLRQVWKQVPAVWQNGRVVLGKPHPGHRCRKQ